MIADKIKEQRGENKYLVFNKQEWIMHRGAGLGFDFTDEEIEAGLNHPRNLLGVRNGVDCYISKPIDYLKSEIEKI